MAQTEAAGREKILAVLELARWAPSGDNAQPWRFEIVDDATLIVHGFDTRAHCVYDLDGRASQIAQGALLETIRIAATGQGLGQVYPRAATQWADTQHGECVAAGQRQGNGRENEAKVPRDW